MYKAYKAEFTLGLVSALLGINLSIFLFFSLDNGLLSDSVHFLNGLLAIAAVLTSLLAFILGFVSVYNLNRNDKSGGKLLLVSGVLMFLTIVLACLSTEKSGYFGVSMAYIPMIFLHAVPSTVMMLIGGFRALSRIQPAPPTTVASGPPSSIPY